MGIHILFLGSSAKVEENKRAMTVLRELAERKDVKLKLTVAPPFFDDDDNIEEVPRINVDGIPYYGLREIERFVEEELMDLSA